jgi:tungstate transport system ATP-binding protein
MSADTPILEIQNLRVQRGGAPVLDIASLSLSGGEILCLIGPNGAGKSTLLLTLARLLKFSEGEMSFKGKRIDSNASLLTYRRNLSMVFQEPLLFDTTVYENIASGLNIRGMNKHEIKDIVEEYADRFGIRPLIDRAAKKLSGGEAQRTSLARAFATKPEIVFLDEPFSSLDPPTRESLIEDLDRVLRETKTTTLMATHDQVEALRLSDRIAVMNRGSIVQIGTPEQVMNYPVDEFVASFVGMQTIFEGVVIKTTCDGVFVASVAGRNIEAVGQAAVGDMILCFIRPENVTLSLERSHEKTSARNIFPGRIDKIVPMGLFFKVHLDCGFPIMAYVTHQSMENLSLMERKSILASFKATAVHVVRKGN